MTKTMHTSIDTVTWVHDESGHNFDEYCMEQKAKQIKFYEQGYAYANRDVKLYFVIKNVVMQMLHHTKHTAQKIGIT